MAYHKVPLKVFMILLLGLVIVVWVYVRLAYPAECALYIIGQDVVEDCTTAVTIMGQADAEKEQKILERRLAVGKELVEAEINRRHELEVRKAEIEVLGRLELLSAPKIYTSNQAFTNVAMRSTQSIDNIEATGRGDSSTNTNAGRDINN